MKGWGPEQIAKRLPVDFPDDEACGLATSRSTKALYVQGRGTLKRERVACLRTGRALRVPRASSRQKPWAHVTSDVPISVRPAEADDRAVPGHWEGDLLIGIERSAIGTVVDRTTRFTLLVHLPPEEGYRHKHTVKNGPALAGYGAVAMKNPLSTPISTLTGLLRRSVTWDRSKELSQLAAFTVETGIPGCFADPHSPQQRDTNENTDGLPWNGFDDVDYATLGSWFNRWHLHGEITDDASYTSPGKFEAAYYRQEAPDLRGGHPIARAVMKPGCVSPQLGYTLGHPASKGWKWHPSWTGGSPS